MLRMLLPFQILFIPGLILLLLWSVYRTVLKKDRAVGLVVYLALVIIVDGFFNTGFFIPGLEQGSIKYSEIFAFFLILGSPTERQSERGGRLIMFLVCLYFLLMFLSSMRGYTVRDGLFEFRRYIVPQMLAFILAYKGFEDREDYARFIFHLMTLLLIISLVTFWDVFFDRSLLKSDMLFKPEYWHNRKIGRFGSLFLNPNHMGTFAVLVFPAVFFKTLLEKITWKRIYGWVSLFALGFALIETKSRGPLLGLAVSLLLLVAMPSRGYSVIRKIGYLVLFLSVFYLVMPGFFEHATERFETMESEAAEDTVSRKTLWSSTQEIISEYPFFGIGLGERQYVEYMLNFGFKEEYSSMPLDNPHNSYLQIAVYAGIPALLVYILLNVLIIKKGLSSAFRNRETDFSLCAIGLLAGIVGFLACIFVDMQLFTENVASVYWLTFGLLYSIVKSDGNLEEA